jgi:hypothetical protein
MPIRCRPCPTPPYFGLQVLVGLLVCSFQQGELVPNLFFIWFFFSVSSSSFEKKMGSCECQATHVFDEMFVRKSKFYSILDNHYVHSCRYNWMHF